MTPSGVEDPEGGGHIKGGNLMDAAADRCLWWVVIGAQICEIAVGIHCEAATVFEC